MPSQKKRPNKKAKAAQKAISESKLLAAARAANELQESQNFRNPDPSPRAASRANKKRPDKKRG
jgi:hypothetical protein